MPEAKILLATDSFSDFSRYYSSQLAGSITDWEEVTDEELSWLRKHINELPEPRYDMFYILVVKDSVTLRYRIESIRGLVEEEMKKEEENRIKKEEANRKRKETKRKNKEAKDKKTLEELRKKYGE